MSSSRVYIGNLDPKASERELEDEFRKYGSVTKIWVARNPPGFAFIDMASSRDAEDAVRRLDGQHGWRVEISRKQDRGPGGRGGGGGGYGGDRYGDRGYGDRGGSRGYDAPRGGRGDMKCYECGDVGHIARDCRIRNAEARDRRGRSRSPDDRVRRSSPDDRRRSPDERPRRASPDDRRRSPDARRRSPSPDRRRDRDSDRRKSPEERRKSKSRSQSRERSP